MADVKVVFLAVLIHWACANAAGAVSATHSLGIPKRGEKSNRAVAQEAQPLGSHRSPLTPTQRRRRYDVHESRLPTGHHYPITGDHSQESDKGVQYPHHDARYAYKYAVHDEHTGDIKKAWEHREGDVTYGGYSLVDPDGHIRIVEYNVTKTGGFQATVKRIPIY